MTTYIFSMFITLVFVIFVFRMIKTYKRASNDKVVDRLKITAIIVSSVYLFIISSLIYHIASK